MLDDIKLALRITHNLLDSEITANIESARAELYRSGISYEKATDEEDALIRQAIKTYCLMMLSNNEKMAEGYAESFKYQMDCLRKSVEYHV